MTHRFRCADADCPTCEHVAEELADATREDAEDRMRDMESRYEREVLGL